MRMLPQIFRARSFVSLSLTLTTACTGTSEQTPAVAAGTPRDTAFVDGIPACVTCSISIVDSVRIGKTSDKLIPVRPPGFLRDSRGQVYLTFSEWNDQPILRYDSAGRFQGRVGKYGQGPGEYRMTSVVLLDPSDSLFVFENGGRIGQVFSPDGKYVRRADVRDERPFAVTASDRLRILTLQRESWPPRAGARHVFRHNSVGALIDSFVVFSAATGEQRTVSSEHETYKMDHVITSLAYGARDGTVWTLGNTNYRLEHHDSAGVSRKLYGVRAQGEAVPMLHAEDVKKARANGQRISDWPEVRSTKTKRVLRPQNWVDVDSAGLLWVGRQIAAPAWDTIAPALQLYPNSEAPEEENLSMDVESRLYHTVIEIIDPAVGQILARVTLPFMGHRVGAGFIGYVTATEDGYVIPSLYRLEFKRK